MGLERPGKLSQRCPCGIAEAAGSYCTRCLRPMGEADWFVSPARGRHAPIPQALRPATPSTGTDMREADIAA